MSTTPDTHAADHGTHLAISISDPDGNDLELCWDRDALLAEAPAG